MRHSQLDQDGLLDAFVFRGFRRGVFVDVGANDGVSLSNSLHFEEEHEWTGVCIEADPAIFPTLVQNRPKAMNVAAAVSDKPGVVDFVQISGPHQMLSGILTSLDNEPIERSIAHSGGERRTIEVPARRLNDILAEYGIREVHYLSIDIEGGEAAVLRVFDFDAVTVHVMTVECNHDEDVKAVRRALGGRFLVAGRLEHDLVLILRASPFASGLRPLRREIRRRTAPLRSRQRRQRSDIRSAKMRTRIRRLLDSVWRR